MKLTRNFSGKDSVIDLIREDYNILQILSRFNIPLGFQSKRIEDVCNEKDCCRGLYQDTELHGRH